MEKKSNQKQKKTKVRLLNPKIYRSLITFYTFSNFENRNNQQCNYDIMGQD